MTNHTDTTLMKNFRDFENNAVPWDARVRLLLHSFCMPQYTRTISQKYRLANNILLYLIYTCRVGRFVFDVFADKEKKQLRVVKRTDVNVTYIRTSDTGHGGTDGIKP